MCWSWVVVGLRRMRAASAERLEDGSLGKVNAKGVHIKAVKEAGKRFTKPSQTFVYKLEVHHVCLKIGHGIRKLGKSRL